MGRGEERHAGGGALTAHCGWGGSGEQHGETNREREHRKRREGRERGTVGSVLGAACVRQMARTHACARARVCSVTRRVNGGPRKAQNVVRAHAKASKLRGCKRGCTAAHVGRCHLPHTCAARTHTTYTRQHTHDGNAAAPRRHDNDARQRTRGSGVAHRPSGEIGVPAGAPSTMTAGRMTSALPCACTFTRKLLR